MVYFSFYLYTNSFVYKNYALVSLECARFVDCVSKITDDIGGRVRWREKKLKNIRWENTEMKQGEQ